MTNGWLDGWMDGQAAARLHAWTKLQFSFQEIFHIPLHKEHVPLPQLIIGMDGWMDGQARRTGFLQAQKCKIASDGKVHTPL